MRTVGWYIDRRRQSTNGQQNWHLEDRLVAFELPTMFHSHINPFAHATGEVIVGFGVGTKRSKQIPYWIVKNSCKSLPMKIFNEKFQTQIN